VKSESAHSLESDHQLQSRRSFDPPGANMTDLTLTLLEGTYAIHRLPPQADVPDEVLASPFFAAMRTEEELSLVVQETIPVSGEQTETGWVCFKVVGVLDLGLVGILAKLATTLANAQVAIFALSSFNTDYLLVKRGKVEIAKRALTSAGYRIDDG
jgi:hypothetical protein